MILASRKDVVDKGSNLGGNWHGGWKTMKDHRLHRQTRTEPKQNTPVQSFAGGGSTVLRRLLSHLVNDEQHAGTGHVSVLAQYMSGGSHLLLLETKLELHLVQYRRTTGVGDPEDGVPVGYPQRRKCLCQSLLYVLRDQPWNILKEMKS